MAASFPALGKPIADTSAAVSTPPTINTSKNLRGLNKPKCNQCGNVARSRCPFQSCKSCCAKAQNPCHIHVLKGQSNLPDKAPSFGSPIVDQQPNDASHPGTSHRPASFRQLSTNFAQFNNLQSPLRSRKPITRKEAEVINEWRFLKLKEFRDNNIEIENEAFDRYMQNVSLLEEVFAVNSSQDWQTDNKSSTENPKPSGEEEKLVAGFKLQLRSDPVRIENTRKRMQCIVEKGLHKRRKLESDEGTNEKLPKNPETNDNNNKSPHVEWTTALSDLIDKLNAARNEEDLKACWEMKTELFKRRDLEKKQIQSDDCRLLEEEASSSKEPTTPNSGFSIKEEPGYCSPKWFSMTTIDQEELSRVSAQFDSLEEIEKL
ncbi:unnamed protein product [Cuscuta europaea]|uniref:Uncharacterized protein n=1 Tax=Cuscuta europaea TaxID=41803 RepID=A0A9P0Z4E9_CUSEU|nr:unnamed protein product [Cuscuta europaea]